MIVNILTLFLAILSVFYVAYGSLLLTKDIFYNVVPYSIILTSLIVFGIHFFRVPAPDAKIVDEIVGKDANIDDEDSDPVIKVIAHRGGGCDAPENSLPAFKMCSDLGCNIIEFDVTLTSDGIPIVFHDTTLERMTDLDLVVNETTWDQLSKIDISVKHRFRERFVNTRIPTLDETISQLLNCGQRMIIDIKDHDIKIRRGNPKIVCSLAWKPYEFSYDICEYDGCPDKPRSNKWYMHCLLLLFDGFHAWALPRITYYLLGLSIILLHKDSLSGESIIEWRKKGLRVMTWTVNNSIEKQHIEHNLKVTYLTDSIIDESTSVFVG